MKIKKRIILVIASVILLISMLLALVIQTNNWFNDNKFLFQSPIQITLHKPVQIVKRELLKPTIIEIVNEIPTLKDLTPIEEYICEKWGAYECKIALAVAKAESGLRKDAIGVNTNKTVDIGIFQINSIHYKKDECSLEKVVTAEGNVDCAFSIWEEQSWQPWVAFTNGSFKSKL